MDLAFVNTFIAEVYYLIGRELLLQYPGIDVNVILNVRQASPHIIISNLDYRAQQIFNRRLNDFIGAHWRHSISHLEKRGNSWTFYRKALDYYLTGDAVSNINILMNKPKQIP